MLYEERMCREKPLVTLSSHLFLDLVNWFLFWFYALSFWYMLLNHALSLLLVGIELPKYLVSEREQSGFSCSLALAAVTHWISGSRILWTASAALLVWTMALNEETLLLSMCISTRMCQLLFLVDAASFISLYVTNYQSGIIFRFFILLHLPSHLIINVDYKLSSIIHIITFYAFIVGFSITSMWKRDGLSAFLFMRLF